MTQGIQFRKVLPIFQTALAAILGGWGLWIRNSILNLPIFGHDTSWNSTARFHVWPWPFKFAVVLNIPAFIAGLFLAWPLDVLHLQLPEYVSYLPALLFVALLWYWIGSWLDRTHNADKGNNSVSGKWILLLVFYVLCAAASSLPQYVGGYVSFLYLGIAVWLLALIAMGASKASQNRNT